MKEEKCLIAYFSRKGNNYVGGSIVNLPIGNTEVIARMIKEFTDGDLFHINTINPYPEDYDDATTVAKRELHSNARPELSKRVDDMDSYNLVFLGYPNWWGTAPMAIRTFLDSYDFSGKQIIPFCTHEGSGLGKSVRDIKNLCPKADVVNPIAFYGRNVKNARDEVEKWVQKEVK